MVIISLIGTMKLVDPTTQRLQAIQLQTNHPIINTEAAIVSANNNDNSISATTGANRINSSSSTSVSSSSSSITTITEEESFCDNQYPLQHIRDRNGEIAGHPIWSVGYPGSGSSVLMLLLSAITDLKANDVYQNTTRSNCLTSELVVCKTHYPWTLVASPDEIARKRTYTPFHPRTWLLLRNPLHAIPSLANYLHEQANDMRIHSQQAPQNVWRQWRDQNFRTSWQSWMDVIHTWHHQGVLDAVVGYNVTLYVPYERMVANDTGPVLLTRMAYELRSAGFTTRDDLACWWNYILKRQKKLKRQVVGYQPSFTTIQRDIIVRDLRRMIQQYSSISSELTDILIQYHQEVLFRATLDD